MDAAIHLEKVVTRARLAELRSKAVSRPLRASTLAFGDHADMQEKLVVTRARFERATPSFGGTNRNAPNVPINVQKSLLTFPAA
jgi:hypothetical protein